MDPRRTLGALLVLAALALVATAPARAATLRAPALDSPAADATVQVLPPFTWSAVKGAAAYEVQVAADDGFGSIVTGRAVKTGNTAFTVTGAVADGTYHWRVRAIAASDKAGRWSEPRTLRKAWTQKAELQAPVSGSDIAYPLQPMTLRWSPVPGAYKYRVFVTTDSSGATSVLSDGGKGIETSGTSLTLPGALPPGRYHWSVVPLDAEKHPGSRASGTFFDTSWASAVTTHEVASPEVDPRFTWEPVPGAVGYDVEVSFSEDFALGSEVFSERSHTTSVSPRELLGNNTYYWRVRAVDVNGNAGQWSRGPDVTKVFDQVTPSVPNLRMRGAAPGADLAHPLVEWDPVPGASAYEVQVTAHQDGLGCDWATRIFDAGHSGLTTTTAWSPLGKKGGVVVQPGSGVWPVAQDYVRQLAPGSAYCVRVLAIAGEDEDGDPVTSEWTYLGGFGEKAFHYLGQPAPADGPVVMTAADYVTPLTGTVTARTPLLAWNPLPTAGSYWVVISRDPPANNTFTNVVEVGFTRVAGYATRTALPDETTSYYWAVLPAKGTDGSGVFTGVTDNAPRAFDKRSEPVELGEGHPTFSWSQAEGAEQYRFQVASEPTFADPIDDVRTAATSYTPTRTYPVDRDLHWRVRAVDGAGNELTWSQHKTFQRRLPTPVLDPANPTGGEGIPVLAWTPVQGAAGYDMHVEQADGTRKDFETGASAFTPTTFYGTGIWRWQVRARFPGGATGPYTALTPFARSIGAPSGAQASRSKTRVVLSWDPAVMAKEYRVEISDSTSFASTVERATTDVPHFAPDLSKHGYLSGGRLYWRVATVDEGNNVGAFATGTLTLARRLVVRALGSVRRKRAGMVAIRVADAGRKPVKGARIRVRGAGLRLARRTPRTGRLSLQLKPRKKGTIVISATKKGYKAGRARLRVR